MSSSSDQALTRVRAGGEAAALTKAQKAFNRWIGRIEGQRRLLAEWRALSEAFQLRIAQDYEPLRRRFRLQQVALMRRMDRIHDSEDLGKRERSRLAQVLLEQVSALLEEHHEPELVELHDKYSDVRHEDLSREEAEVVRAMVEDILGTALEEDLSSPEEVLRAAREWLRDRSAATYEADAEPSDGTDQAWAESDRPGAQGSQEASGRAANSGPSEAGEPGHADGRSGAQSRPSARVQREQALAEAATQSVRDAWRKLVSALHPDREPDPAERERKTALMQRANQAYEARDLLQLLSLQIEVEQTEREVGQTERSGLSAASDTQLLHYNRALKAQSEGLAAEISAVTAHFEMSMNGRPRGGWTPTSIMAALNQDIASLQRALRGLTDDLDAFRDIRYVKAWLKTVRISRSTGAASAGAVEEVDAFLAEVMLARAMGVPFGDESGHPERGSPSDDSPSGHSPKSEKPRRGRPSAASRRSDKA